MKRIGIWMLLITLLAVMPIAATAEATDEETEPVFTFDLAVNGKHEVQVEPGDVITVVFTITRTDEDEDDSYIMYSMQNEIEYDDSFVMPAENGCITRAEIDTSDIALRGYGREFYMNYLSLVEGVEWSDNQLVGTFQLQVNADSGITELNNRNCIVTKQDASRSYEVVTSDLLLYVSDECTIRFESNGGSTVENAVTNYGELLERPSDPVKEGQHLRGWYKDYDLTEPWDFENEPVSKNMVLYAAWDDGEPETSTTSETTTQPSATATPVQGKRVRITFEVGGGKPIADIWVNAGEVLNGLPTPVRAGYSFAGWYKDAAHTQVWNIANDIPQDKKTKLYAAWEKN